MAGRCDSQKTQAASRRKAANRRENTPALPHDRAHQLGEPTARRHACRGLDQRRWEKFLAHHQGMQSGVAGRRLQRVPVNIAHVLSASKSSAVSRAVRAARTPTHGRGAALHQAPLRVPLASACIPAHASGRGLHSRHRGGAPGDSGASLMPTPYCASAAAPGVVTGGSVTAMAPSATEEGAAASVSLFSAMPDPPGLMYDALVGLHAATGFEWAGTFALATVLMRVGMLPLSIFADRNARRFGRYVTPQIHKLHQDLSPTDNLGRPRPFANAAEFRQVYGVFFQAVRTLWRRHQCSPAKSVASPLLQLPLFICASVAIRRLCGPQYEALKTGGALWFEDLTIAAMDGFLKVNMAHPEALILPAITTGLAITNAHLAFGEKLPLLKRVVIMLPIICLPLTYQLPQALFCYWGTSFAFTTAQILCQRTAAYRRLVEPQDDRTEDAAQAARHRQGEGAVFIAGDKEGAEDVGLDRAEATRRAAAGPGGGEGEGEGGDKISSLDDSASSLEDLNARIAHVQATLKDSPTEQRKAMMDIMVQRMTYERQHVLRAILEEVHAEVQRRGGQVDAAACQLVRQGIDDARAAGKIIALPPVKVVLEEPSDLAQDEGKEPRTRGAQIKLVFPDTSAP